MSLATSLAGSLMLPKTSARVGQDAWQAVTTAPSLTFCGSPEIADSFEASIRTALMRDGTAYVQAGGGVVADSNGPYEYTEAANKARAVRSAIAAAGTVGGCTSDAVPANVTMPMRV